MLVHAGIFRNKWRASMGTLSSNTNSKGRRSGAFMQLIAAHSVAVAAVDALETVVAGDAEVQVAVEEGVTPIP
jgi:hypothetical protein